MKLTERIALNSSAQAARQIVLAVTGIASVAIATRYLSVDAYGGILASLVLIGLLSFATDFGVAGMTVRAMARDPDNETKIQSSAFWVWVALTIPTALLILAVAQLSYPGPDGETSRDATLVLMSIFPLMPFSGVAMVRATADQRVWVTSVSSMIARPAALGVQVAVVALDLGPMGITAAFACGFVFDQILAIIFVRPKIEFGADLHRGRIWSLVVAAVPLGLVMIINGLYFRLDAFLISILATERDLAMYGVAYKAFESFLAFPEFVMVTLLPVLARLDFSEPRFQELIQKAFTAMVLMALPIVGLSLLGKEAMVALGGAKYAGGGLVLALIMCAVAFACVQGVFGNALVTQGRQKLLLRVSLSVLVANGLINLVAIPIWGDTGAAAALLVTEILALTLTLGVYRRYAPIPRVQNPGRTLAALGALVAVAGGCILISPTEPGMVVAIILGLTAYIVALVVLRVLPSYMAAPVVSVLRLIRPRARSAT